MNTPSFEVKTKPAGAKTRYTILADGNEIGSRTTARPYRFALVVKKNQAREIETVKETIAYQLKQAEKYEGVARRDPACYQQAVREFNYDSTEKRIRDGSYAQWAVEARECAARYVARLAELQSGPLPEFDELIVASWHHARHLVPDAKPWQIFVAIVEIA